MVKNRHDQIIIFHKSKLLLLYYTISFLVIRVGSALIMFREAGLRELEMTTGGSDDGDILLLQRILSVAVFLLLISAWNSMDYWISSRKPKLNLTMPISLVFNASCAIGFPAERKNAMFASYAVHPIRQLPAGWSNASFRLFLLRVLYLRQYV